MVGSVLSSMVKVTEMLVDTLLLPSVARTYTVLPPKSRQVYANVEDQLVSSLESSMVGEAVQLSLAEALSVAGVNK